MTTITQSSEKGAPVVPAQIELRDYFAAAALANVNICTGRAAEYDLREWFGENAQNISREQIAARQAINCADAMLKARSRSGSQHASLMQCAEALRECRAWIDETYVVDSCRHERDADCYSCQAISLFDRIDEALSSLEMRPDLVERLGGT